MHFWQEWLLVVSVFIVAVMAPGPDFVMAVRNSVLHGRKAGMMTALGFTAGVSIHITYCILGLSAIIAQSLWLFTLLKYAGAGYLIYIGVKALRSKGMHHVNLKNGERSAKTAASAFRDGFLTNLLNPKAILFFFALFTQIVQPHQPIAHLLAYGLSCMAIMIVWFSSVALFLTQARIRNVFLKISAALDKACGALFILLGIRLALQKATS
ncbi:MAG: LysE family transporter [Proteobacteria bacterium]|nr:LysE family transporter [Pseudomonadota bacterium]